MKRSWINFEFTGSKKLASVKSRIRGMVNKESGESSRMKCLEHFLIMTDMY